MICIYCKTRISLSMRFLREMTDTLVAFVLHYVLKYRLNVIKKNLSASFSYADEKELKGDIQAFYRYLAKVFRQIIARPSARLLSRRLHLNPCPSLDKWLLEGKSVIITFGHTGNWEWTGSFVGLQYPDQVCALYKKIKSPRINAMMYKRRLFHVNYLVEIKQMGELLRLMKARPLLILMIADQNPASAKGAIWTSFLGRKTAFVNGPESLSLRYGLPVVYMHTAPRADSGYDLTCQEIYDGAESVEPGVIMQRFAERLETNIRECRSHWLWSHKRWKRKAPEDEVHIP